MNLIFEKTSDAQWLVWNSGKQQTIGTFYIQSDGFFCFLPDPRVVGFWNETMLRELADKLAEINKPWSEQCDRELGS